MRDKIFMADNIQFRMFCIQPLRNMSPCDKMNLSHPWRIFLHPAKPVPEIIPISVPFFSIIRIYRYIHICVSHPCSLFSLPFQVISIYPGNNKIYILRVLIYFSHVLFPTYHFVSISIPYLFSLLQIKKCCSMRLLYSQKQHSHLSFGLILFSHTNSEVPAKQGVQVVGMIILSTP